MPLNKETEPNQIFKEDRKKLFDEINLKICINLMLRMKKNQIYNMVLFFNKNNSFCFVFLAKEYLMYLKCFKTHEL